MKPKGPDYKNRCFMSIFLNDLTFKDYINATTRDSTVGWGCRIH